VSGCHHELFPAMPASISVSQGGPKHECGLAERAQAGMDRDSNSIGG
jgi:hypothetical protein